MWLIELFIRLLGMCVMLAMWATIGLMLCIFISLRSLIALSGKNVYNAYMDRPFVSSEQFTHSMLLWPRKVVDFVVWGFTGAGGGQPSTIVRNPLELLLETVLFAFFFVTLIWANEVKPGYLPNVFAFWTWVWDVGVSVLRQVVGIVARLFGFDI